MKRPTVDHPLFSAPARVTARGLAIPLALFLAVGCNKAHPLVGKWTGSMSGMQQEIEFFEGKTFTAVAKQAMIPNASFIMKGTWQVDGDKLTQTVTSVDVPGLPPQFKPQIDAVTRPMINNPQSGKVKVDGDTATITTTQGSSYVLTRVKSAE